MEKLTVLAVDGNSLIWRAHYALAKQHLTDDFGRPVSATIGFWNLVGAVCSRVHPDALVIGFDSPVSNRKLSYPGYKATREDRSDLEMHLQINAAMEIATEIGISVIQPEGWEADDVTASTAARATELGWDCVIATSDRDALAHVSDSVTVMRLVSGIDNALWMTPKSLFDKYGIRPDQYVDYAALRGDPSDNLDGVSGIGEKMAAKLLASFGTVQAALDAPADELVAVLGKAKAAKLVEQADRWQRNREIMEAKSTIDIPVRDAMLRLDPDVVRQAFSSRGYEDLSRRMARILSAGTPKAA